MAWRQCCKVGYMSQQMLVVAWVAVEVKLLSAAAVVRALRTGIVWGAGAELDVVAEGVVVGFAQIAHCRLGERTAVAC